MLQHFVDYLTKLPIVTEGPKILGNRRKYSRGILSIFRESFELVVLMAGYTNG